MVLDDLHTADPSSLALLHFLARNLRGLRALVVGTYRDEEARLVVGGGALLGDVAREGAYLPLAPLDRGEHRRAGGQRRRAAASRTRWWTRSERATEGNPLFLNELLRLLVRARGPRAQAAMPGRRCPSPTPSARCIGRRIARLPPETRAALLARRR